MSSKLSYEDLLNNMTDVDIIENKMDKTTETFNPEEDVAAIAQNRALNLQKKFRAYAEAMTGLAQSVASTGDCSAFFETKNKFKSVANESDDATYIAGFRAAQALYTGKHTV